MNDPIELLGAHPLGAVPRRPDTRDYHYSPLEIAEAGAPFEWKDGNVPDPVIDALLPTKNQGTSGSCGGQSFAYYGQVLRAKHAGLNAERSAKYLYSQVFAPGGGSDDRALANIAIKQGFGLEEDTPSYDHGQPPLEPFMERPQDITPTARLNAARDQASIAYAFPLIDIDAVAQAATACDGIILGLRGSNNGTWLSQVPKPPTYEPKGVSNSRWSHYMYAHTPQIRNGVKGIWAKQSWGPNVGLNGWQFIDEEYFASGAVWGAIVLIYNPSPIAPPSHTFLTDIKQGSSGQEVTALQQFLVYDGELNVAPTGYYGPITAQAVLRFQLKYRLAAIATLDELGGSVVGPAPRNALNRLLAH